MWHRLTLVVRSLSQLCHSAEWWRIEVDWLSVGEASLNLFGEIISEHLFLVGLKADQCGFRSLLRTDFFHVEFDELCPYP